MFKSIAASILFFLFFHYENDLEATFKSTIPYFLKKSQNNCRFRCLLVLQVNK